MTTLTTDVTTQTAAPPALDWFYLRAYPGSSRAVDTAAGVLVPWLREQARREGATRWFFMRYLDMSGQHLRLRLQAVPDAVDRLHARVGEVESLLHTLPEIGPHGRLLEGADLAELPGPRLARPAMFAPELEKYGGPRGVELALDLATAGSTWFDEQRIVSLRPRFQRTALAVAFQRLLVTAALDEPDRRAFWASHQRQWGWQLRMLVPTPEQFRACADETVEGIAGARPSRDRLRSLDQLVAGIVSALDLAQAAGVPRTRAELLLDHLHMEMNRWGFMPAEECLIGMLARTGPAPQDRKEAS